MHADLQPFFVNGEFDFNQLKASPKLYGKAFRHFCQNFTSDPGKIEKLRNELLPCLKRYYEENHPEMPARRFLRCLADTASVVDLATPEQDLFRTLVQKVEENPDKGCHKTASALNRNLAAVKRIMGERFLNSTLSAENENVRTNFLLLYPHWKCLHEAKNDLAESIRKNKQFSLKCDPKYLQQIADFAEGHLKIDSASNALELRDMAQDHEIEGLLNACDDFLAQETAKKAYAIDETNVHLHLPSKNAQLRIACYDWINSHFKNIVKLKYDRKGDLTNTILLDLRDSLERDAITLLLDIIHLSKRIEFGNPQGFEQLLKIKEARDHQFAAQASSSKVPVRAPAFEAEVVHLKFHEDREMDDTLWTPFLRIFPGVKTLHIHCGEPGDIQPLLRCQHLTTIFVENPASWNVPLEAYKESKHKTVMFLKEEVYGWFARDQYVIDAYPALLLRRSGMFGQETHLRCLVARPPFYHLFDHPDDLEANLIHLKIHHPGLTDEALIRIFSEYDQDMDKDDEYETKMTINLSNCSLITDLGFKQLLDETDDVTSIDIQGCTSLTPQVLAMIKDKYPELEDLFHDFGDDVNEDESSDQHDKKRKSSPSQE